MIEYLNTINSHTAATKTVKIPVGDEEMLMAGSVCQMSDGILTKNYTAGKTAYLTLEGKNPGDGKDAIECVRLAVGMVLRGDVMNGATSLKFGDHIDFTQDTLEYYNLFSSTGTALEVIANDDTYATVIVNKI